MSEMPNTERLVIARDAGNPWKIAVLTVGGILLLLAALVVVASALRSDAPVVVTAVQPTQSAVDDCNHLAAQAATEPAREPESVLWPASRRGRSTA